jgi:hypothetical protein
MAKVPSALLTAENALFIEICASGTGVKESLSLMMP